MELKKLHWFFYFEEPSGIFLYLRKYHPTRKRCNRRIRLRTHHQQSPVTTGPRVLESMETYQRIALTFAVLLGHSLKDKMCPRSPLWQLFFQRRGHPSLSSLLFFQREGHPSLSSQKDVSWETFQR